MFKQVISWSAASLMAFGAVYLVTSAAMLVPAFLSGTRGVRTALVSVWFLVTVLLVGVAVVFRTLTITIEHGSLNVAFGPLHERLPLPAITDCRVVSYDWREWGGWGIRYGRGATLYNVAGDHGLAVQISRDDGTRLLFSSPDPQATCGALQVRR